VPPKEVEEKTAARGALEGRLREVISTVLVDLKA